MNSFLLGLLTGFFMNVPIGPLNVWVMATSLHQDPIRAFFMALGGIIVDVLYLFLIASGIKLFLDFSSGEYSGIWKLCGGFIILCLGIAELRKRPHPTLTTDQSHSQAQPLEHFSKKVKKSLLHCFLMGLFLNLSNPTIIVTLTGLVSYLKSIHLFIDQGSQDRWSFSTGALLGSVIWFGGLSLVVFTQRHRFSEKKMVLIQKGTGLLIIVLALSLIISYLQNFF